MKKISLLIALLGAALLVWVMAHTRLSVLRAQLRAVRTALPIILMLSLCRLLLQSSAWRQVLQKEGATVNTSRVLGIRLASQSMGYLTMLGALISEPMKIKLLQAPVDKAATATLVDDAVYWTTSALSGLVGCFFVALLTQHVGRFVASSVMILVFSAFLVFITWRTPVLSLVCRRFKDKAPSWLLRSANIEKAAREYRIKQPNLIRRIFGIDLLCQLLLTAEVVVVLWSLHLPVHPVPAFSIDGLTRIAKLASGWIPARLGADEAGAISAFSVAGLSPILGLTLAFTRRSRDLLWSVCGIAWLAWRSRNSSEAEIQGQLLNQEEVSL
jgi:hypothetical protein